jgi:hypothetical protein
MSDERRKGQSSHGDCRVKGCTTKTAENKPYCIDHIEQSPHAKRILDYLAEREVEEDRATRPSGWKRIDVNGSRAREIMEYLAIHGAQSPKRLALKVEIAPAALDAYITALEKAKAVRLLTLGSRRGTPRQVIALCERAA